MTYLYVIYNVFINTNIISIDTPYAYECAAFYHIRNISNIRGHFIHKAAFILSHMHVISRLDCYNFMLLYGLPDKLQNTIQKAQDSAARVVI